MRLVKINKNKANEDLKQRACVKDLHFRIVSECGLTPMQVFLLLGSRNKLPKVQCLSAALEK